MRFELDPLHRDVPDEDLIADLRRAASEGGASTLTWERYSSTGRFSPETVRRRFGSWNGALGRAGLLSSKRWRIPDDDLFANLETIWRQLGRQPRRSDLDVVATSVSKSVYEQRFGTWRKALEAFMARANEEERTSPPHPTAPVSKKTSRQPSLRLRFRVMRRDRFRCCHCGQEPLDNSGSRTLRRPHQGVGGRRRDRAGEPPDALHRLQPRKGARIRGRRLTSRCSQGRRRDIV